MSILSSTPIYETLGEILSYLDVILPNSLETLTKIVLINDEIKEIWRDMSPYYIYSFTTVEGQMFYNLPAYYRFDQIYEDGLKIATTEGTVTEDTIYNTYSFCASEDELSGHSFFDGLEDNFGIYPEPDGEYNAKIKLVRYPDLYDETNTSEVVDLDRDYIKLLKLRVLSRIAKSGSFPRVDLANNYYVDALELEKKMKYYNKRSKFKDRRHSTSYKDGWDI